MEYFYVASRETKSSNSSKKAEYYSLKKLFMWSLHYDP